MSMFDNQLIESAYLSELWAVNNIKRHETKYGSIDLAMQLDDEERHAAILLEALRAEGYEPLHDTAYSMQEVIYRNWLGLDLDRFTDIDRAHFCFAHEVTERRAIWIYRTYIRGGQNSRFKEICAQIIDDERGHIHAMEPTNESMENLMRKDRLIFRKYIPGEYGSMNLLETPQFWSDYYGEGLKEIGA